MEYQEQDDSSRNRMGKSSERMAANKGWEAAGTELGTTGKGFLVVGTGWD